MHPIVEDCDIDVNDIAVLNNRRVRDTVTNNLVYRRTARSGELVIVQGRRVGVPGNGFVVNEFVNFSGGHADFTCSHCGI